MKTLAIIFLVLMGGLSLNLKAQTKKNTVGFGLNVNQIQNDFGVGIDIISPYFVNSKMAVKIGGSFKWLEYLEETETTWTPYQNVQIGIRGRQFIVEDKVFIYGEGGSIALFPNTKFSSEDIELGGYGLFGFELKAFDKFGFYFEMGGAGTGAEADKTINRAIYSNGFLTNAGIRITP